jgi:hypothetical protein
VRAARLRSYIIHTESCYGLIHRIYQCGAAANTALVGQSALTDLDTIVSYAGSLGLRVILDNHRSEAGNSNESSGLWYTSVLLPESAMTGCEGPDHW